MTYTVIWRNEARQAMSRLRAADSSDARLLIAAVGALTANPHPTTSNQLGGSRFWRLRLAELRVVYEVDDAQRAIHIYSVGRVPPLRR